jgi:hypothetical protein
MVTAIIRINEETNRVLNIVKAQHGLKDKSQAIEHIIAEYKNQLVEPKLKPTYVKKLQKIAKEKHIYIGEFSDLKKKFSTK